MIAHIQPSRDRLLVMRDHPAWHACAPNKWGRMFPRSGTGEAVITDQFGHMDRIDRASTRPVLYRLDPVPPGLPPELADALTGLGIVARWRTPSLWDAVLTAIIRQVIRADQARRLYDKLCIEQGSRIVTPSLTAHLAPDAETVAAMPDHALSELGLAFKIPALRSAATAYLRDGESWAALEPADLMKELQRVPRIGPWTASAAVADYSGDFAFYPYGDLAVRTWATAAAPSAQWPTKEAPFAALWAELAGDQLSALTMLTLAWGDHRGKLQIPHHRT